MMAEEGDAYKCGICKKEFKDFVTFLQHKSSLGVYKCKLCNLSFHDRDDIQKHIQAVHVNQKVDVAFTIPTNASIINTKPEPPPSTTGTKSGYAVAVYTCRLCNRFTTVERSMLLHLQTVHKIHVVPGSVELGALMLCSRPLDSAYTTKLQAALAEGKPPNKPAIALTTIGTQTNMTFCTSQLSVNISSNGAVKEDSFAVGEIIQPLDKSDWSYTVLSDEVLKELEESKEILEGKGIQESKDAMEDKEILEANKILGGKDMLEVATQEIEMKNIHSEEILQQEPVLEEIQTEQVILEEIPTDQMDLHGQIKAGVCSQEMPLAQEITTEEVSPFEDDKEMVVLKSPSVSNIDMEVDSEDGKAPKMTSILKKNIITYSRAAMKAAAKNTVVLSAKQQPLPTIDQAHDYIGVTPKIASSITEIKASEIQINKVFPKVTLLKNKAELFSAASPKKILNSPKPKLQASKRKPASDGSLQLTEKKVVSPRPVGRPKLSSYGHSSPSKKQNFISDEEDLSEEIDNDPQPGLDGMFHCKHCNRAFARERQYKAHMSVHLMYGEHYLESPGGPQQRKKSKLNI